MTNYPHHVKALLNFRPEKYLPLKPDFQFPGQCSNCGGASYVHYMQIIRPSDKFSLAARDLTEFGYPGLYETKIFGTPCPDCTGDYLLRLWESKCGLSSCDFDLSFDDFITEGDLSEKAEAKGLAIQIASLNPEEMFGLMFSSLTFYGGYGVGKTMLLKIIVNELCNRGIMARYTTMAGLLDEVRNKYTESGGSAEKHLSEYESITVLAIDEVDRFSLTDWAKEKAFRLLDQRLNDEVDLTLFASNLHPRDFNSELGYLSSRLLAGVICELPGPDIRQWAGAIATDYLFHKNEKEDGTD